MVLLPPPSWLLLILEIFLISSIIALGVYRWCKDHKLIFVLKRSNNAQGFSSSCFAALFAGYLILIALHSFAPVDLKQTIGSIPLLENPLIGWLGIGLVILGIGVTTWSQIAMGRSWRIGIDQKETLPLVSGGIYALSRNPIYVGIMLIISGFTLALPNAISLSLALGVFISVSYQIRLEEAHLMETVGQTYADYCKKVRRWI